MDISKYIDPIQMWAAIGVVVFIGIALYTDLKTRRIPNALNVTSLVIALTLHTVFGGVNGLLFSLGGFAVGFGILFILWVIGGGGGGDMKMMGAAGAWVGALPILIIFIASAFFAVMCTIVMMVRKAGESKKVLTSLASGRGESSPTSEASGQTRTDARNALKQHIPYAVPVAMATACVVLVLLVGGSGNPSEITAR